MNRPFFSALLCAALLVGCSAPEPVVVDKAWLTSPPAAGVTDSPLTIALRSVEGKEAQVFLYAADEVVEVVPRDGTSCMANEGDVLREGRYDFWLLPDGSDEPSRQAVGNLFGFDRLQFNASRPRYLMVLPGKRGQQPDLLTLHQYGTCSSTAVTVLALTPDGQELVAYDFSREKGPQREIYVGKLEPLKPGLFRTTTYINSSRMYHITEWQVKPHERLLVPVKEETREL